MAIRAKMTKEGLLIPREVAERALAGSEEAEIFEEPGRLVVAAAGGLPASGSSAWEDPLLGLGENPVRTGARDGSTNHDRYLYTGE